MLTRTAKKEDQVETRLRLKRVAGGHNGRRTVQTVRWTSCITPWASLTFDDGPDPLWTPRILGIEPSLWRTPWGVHAPWTQEVAEEFGLRLASWRADTKDWRGDTVPEMLGRIEPLLGQGSIVLMHDGLGPGAQRTGCEETVALVEPLVARLRELGCEPTPLGVAVGEQEVEA